jgi:Skp family chaperone for outer membrane proteins
VWRREQLEREKAGMQREMEGKRQELEKLRDELEKKGSPHDARRPAREAGFVRAQAARRRAPDGTTSEGAREEGAGAAPASAPGAVGVIDRVGKDKGYYIIVEKRGASVLYASPDAD